jgi:hypothetical protein
MGISKDRIVFWLRIACGSIQPSLNHIADGRKRKWVVPANNCFEKPEGKSSVRVLESLLYHRDAFFHALAQRAVDLLLALAQREGLVGDVQRSQHRDF